MEYQIFSRSASLNNISDRKVSAILNELSKIESGDVLRTAYMRYSESNIPIEYWSKSMEKNFVGKPILMKHYKDYISDLNKAFIAGKSFCLAGTHGVGKTLTSCCVLKKACDKGYNCLYTTLSDVVHVLTKSPDIYLARKELLEVDFLLIDEYDNRFISTDNASDLFARTLESIFRTRSQNKMPTLFCTNSPNVLNSFNGSLKESLTSIMSNIKTISVVSEDFRKNSNS